ncbi:type II secretion system F family protein [Vallicoccus soli]|uniref:Pilus assembly protein TadB n=1 Tax=Vallicoccus soli TaxID=2339232 RepID=A0A3A3Z1R0_9ACTN|nr:pilus assembly protein TadB [Vallicoccus soli]
MPPHLSGALVGLLASVGLLLAVTRVPALRRPTLDDRLAPYLRDPGRTSRLLASQRALTPFPTLERIVGPLLRDATRGLERVLGGGHAVRVRLEQAGRGTTLEEFRVEQVLWGAGALLAALAASLLLIARGSVDQPVVLLVGCLLAGAGGVVARDRALGAQVARREQRMLQEFPTVAELLALAVAAGEGPIGALERTTRTSRGELSGELARALADARAGASLVQALQGIASRTSLPALARFVDGISVAVERGTPLADVLRAQAVDVREAGKRHLLEAGGRKEIAMMVPVVFLVLPVTVVFALFPGIVGLSFTA